MTGEPSRSGAENVSDERSGVTRGNTPDRRPGPSPASTETLADMIRRLRTEWEE